jgi:hypothetical protein
MTHAMSIFRPLLLVAVFALGARADSVSLIDGRTFEGKVSFDAREGLVVLPRNQPSQRVELADVLSVQIDSKKVESPKRLVTLVNGAQIAATDILALTESEVRIKRPSGGLLSFSPVVLRSIQFHFDRPNNKPPHDGFVGVQTREGDLSEGEVLGFEQSQLRISSVLFGMQEFGTDHGVHAVYLRPPGVSRAKYVVKSTDGSSWHAASMKIDRGTLKLTTDTVGEVDLPGDSVVSITLGPASAESAPGGGTFALNPGETKEIKLGRKYRAALLNIRVPPQFVPNRPVQFVIMADGKQLTKTPPMTSLDGPTSVALSVEDKSTLTIRCAADGPDLVGVSGEISDARLVRGE